MLHTPKLAIVTLPFAQGPAQITPPPPARTSQPTWLSLKHPVSEPPMYHLQVPLNNEFSRLVPTSSRPHWTGWTWRPKVGLIEGNLTHSVTQHSVLAHWKRSVIFQQNIYIWIRLGSDYKGRVRALYIDWPRKIPVSLLVEKTNCGVMHIEWSHFGREKLLVGIFYKHLNMFEWA